MAMSVGGKHTLALDDKGSIYVCGKGVALGIEKKNASLDNPWWTIIKLRRLHTLDGSFVTQVSAGEKHSMALTGEPPSIELRNYNSFHPRSRRSVHLGIERKSPGFLISY